MWYFVRQYGNVLAKSKEVYLIWKAWNRLVSEGYDPDTLEVVDELGNAL